MANSKFSIITVCLNSADYIETAIRSVLSQDYDNYEYIIIDGGSTDGTLDIIDKYKKYIHKIISEKDDGIYSAMNKGIAISSGEILYFLNSDDSFFDRHVLSDISLAFANTPDIELLYGFVKREDVTESLAELAAHRAVNNLYGLLKGSICHQALFVKKSLVDKIGPFDTRYSVCADFDWLVSAFSQKAKFKRIDRFIANYDYTGFSNVPDRTLQRERTTIIRRRFSFLFFLCYYIRFVLLRNIRTFLATLGI